MRKLAVLLGLMAALSGVTAGQAPASSQDRFNGACGGGNTFNDFVAGLKVHGVLDDVLRAAKVDMSGVDGPPLRLLKQRMVRVRVARGDYSVVNATCKNGKFVTLKKRTTQAADSFVWVLKREVVKSSVVKRWWDDNCGNMRRGSIVVAYRSTPTKTAEPKPEQTTVETTTTTLTVVVKVGDCNAINSPGANVCNQFTIKIENCSGLALVFQGNNSDEVAQRATQYVAQNCPTTTVPQPTTTPTTPTQPAQPESKPNPPEQKPKSEKKEQPNPPEQPPAQPCQNACDPGPFPPPSSEPDDPVIIENPDPPQEGD